MELLISEESKTNNKCHPNTAFCKYLNPTVEYLSENSQGYHIMLIYDELSVS